MVAAAVTLSVLGLLHWGGDSKVDYLRAGGWGVEVKQDRFTGAKHCQAKYHGVVLDGAVATFRFWNWTDTANAVFRVDGGPLTTAGSVAIEAAGLGADFQTKNFDNPSNGEVHIPYRLLVSAKEVDIKPNGKAGHRAFRVDGIAQAAQAMQSRGCVVG
jgi:hypothetical protein